MKDIILRQEDIDRFDSHLGELAAKARLDLALLIHKDGHLLAAQVVNTERAYDTVALAALVSANFSSSMAVAHLIGETEFKTQFHTGTTHSIFISLVDDDTYLVTIFPHSTTPDTVKVYAAEYGLELQSALRILYENEMDGFEEEELPLDKTIHVSREDLAARAQSDARRSAPPSQRPKAPSSPSAGARVLPHTARKDAQPAAIEETSVFYLELPDDYYHHRLVQTCS